MYPKKACFSVIFIETTCNIDGILGAYYLKEKSGWGVESITVSDLPVYRRIAISALRFESKKSGAFV